MFLLKRGIFCLKYKKEINHKVYLLIFLFSIFNCSCFSNDIYFYLSWIIHFIFNLRGKTSHSTLLELWKKFKVSDPEKHFDRLLKQEIIRLKAEWKKRYSQLFSAYPKFSTRCGDWLVASQYRESFTGFPEETVSDASPEDMRKYYSAEEESAYGVIGIEISLLCSDAE